MTIKKIEKCENAKVVTVYVFDEYMPNDKLLGLLSFLGLDNKSNGIIIANNSIVNKDSK